jgi:hypothetical protein
MLVAHEISKISIATIELYTFEPIFMSNEKCSSSGAAGAVASTNTEHLALILN